MCNSVQIMEENPSYSDLRSIKKFWTGIFLFPVSFPKLFSIIIFCNCCRLYFQLSFQRSLHVVSLYVKYSPSICLFNSLILLYVMYRMFLLIVKQQLNKRFGVLERYGKVRRKPRKTPNCDMSLSTIPPICKLQRKNSQPLVVLEIPPTAALN